MAEGVRLVEESFRLYASGGAQLAPRLVMPLTGLAGNFRIMAANVSEMGGFGLKTLTGIPGKRRAGSTYFAMLYFDGATGALSCVLPATHITRIRTGAASAVAAKYLARDDARTVGIFGAGVQARAQIAALREVRKLERVKVFDVVPEAAGNMACQLAEQGIEASVAASPRDAVAGSDIVVSATTSSEPIVLGEWLEEGMHVNSVGANSPAKRELDGEAFQRARLVVDFKEQVLQEAGDVMSAIREGVIPESHIHAELGEIVVGTKKGRESPSQVTVFKSVGVAIEDVAVAAWVAREAEAKGLGTLMDLQA
jgi:ornithine cyclodeaminase/alanine dehydrogenase-like protein (mu-crystallin family)